MSLYDHPKLYDELLPVTKDCLEFYRDLASEHGPALELACGTGQLTVPIALSGVSIEGLDISTAMLNIAKQRAKDAGVAVTFTLGDIRSFDVKREFSLIFIARNSLLHLTTLDDLRACFRSVSRHLSRDGVFAFDVFSPDVALLARPSVAVPVMQMESPQFGAIELEETPNYDPATQINRITWHVRVRGAPFATFPLHMRNIFPQELPVVIRDCGFELVQLFGDWNRSAFTSASPRQLAVCRPR